MIRWVQDYLPGMEFPAEEVHVCPKCGTASCLEDAMLLDGFADGESCD